MFRKKNIKFKCIQPDSNAQHSERQSSALTIQPQRMLRSSCNSAAINIRAWLSHKVYV